MTTGGASVDVLIAGGGPFGLTLAIELGRRGVDAAVIDARPGTAVNPQANATQARTMEHFRRLGFADEVRALGLPADYPTDIAYFTRYTARELARFRRPPSRDAAQLAREGAAAIGMNNAAELPHRVSQKFVEPVLRRHAERVASVEYGVGLQSFSQDATGVDAVAVDSGTGATRCIRARYLVGGDGARSLVRRELGIRLAGETGVTRDFMGGRMVAVHLRAPGFYDAVPHDRAWMYWAFNTERRSWVAAVNGVDEFAFHTQLKPDEEAQDVGPDLARRLFDQVMGRSIAIELLSVDTWIAGHALVADRFGDGRVLIGGDAAHLFTPAGGLGYNTAVEDAVNLGWKLAALVRGVGGPALLDSYEAERRPLALRNTGFARQLARSIGEFVPDPALERDDAEGEAARAAAADYLEAHARREFNIPGITFGGRYDASPVILSDGLAPTADRMDVYEPSASPGGRLPHLWLDDGASIYDRLGPDWALIATQDASDEERAIADAAGAAGVALTIVRVTTPEARLLYAAPFVLVRPDQIVAWRGDGRGIGATGMFDTVLGRAAAVARPAAARA
ncbi:MAG: FAD-dependent oxidoreductase [Sphingomonas adhaesiva]|uniref:FAD-dependent oxidoreductase n=1 Tax=Sphingomonas adhaesiva TaxID=28212 RepID=UPI002FFAC6C1